MARTDKDRPYWVRCEDETEHRYIYHQHIRYVPGVGLTEAACDFDESARNKARWSNCGYVLDRYYSVPTPPKWFVDHVWNGVERTRQRSQLRELVKEYNGSDFDDVDGDFPNRQHRHCAQWLWW